MTRENIYRMALLYFNISYDEMEPTSKERLFCEQFMDSAEEFCISQENWNFLMKRHDFSDDERVIGSYMGLGYGYVLPVDFFKCCFVNDRYNIDFAIRGNEIYFASKNPSMDYIIGKLDYENFNYPKTFAVLLSAQLAIKVSPMLAPDAQIEQRIASQYAIAFSQLQKNNQDNRRIANPTSEEMVPPHGNTRYYREKFD